MNKEAIQYELKKFFDDEAAEFLSTLYSGNEPLLIRRPGKVIGIKKDSLHEDAQQTQLAVNF